MSYKVIAVGNVTNAGKFKKQDLILRAEDGTQKTITRWQKFEPALTPGDIIDGEVREGKEYKGTMQYSIDKVKVETKAAGAPENTAKGASVTSYPDLTLTVGEFLGAMKGFHVVAKELEPKDADARVALVNTALIALSNGKIKKDAPVQVAKKVTKKKEEVVEDEEVEDETGAVRGKDGEMEDF